MNYEHRRLKLIADMVKNKLSHLDHINILDIGFARQPNQFPLKDNRNIMTGLDRRKNDTKTHYHSELTGDATENLSHLGTFDVIIAAEFIEHLENPYHFLRNLHEVSKDDSLLIISTPNPAGFPNYFFELFMSKKYFYADAHYYYLLPRWVHKMLRATGWETVQTKGVGAYFRNFGIPVPYILSYCVIYVAKKSR